MVETTAPILNYRHILVIPYPNLLKLVMVRYPGHRPHSMMPLATNSTGPRSGQLKDRHITRSSFWVDQMICCIRQYSTARVAQTTRGNKRTMYAAVPQTSTPVWSTFSTFVVGPGKFLTSMKTSVTMRSRIVLNSTRISLITTEDLETQIICQHLNIIQQIE